MPQVKWRTGVYVWRNKVNGKVYVGGASVSFKARLKDYRKRFKKGTCHNIHLQRAWDNYGKDAFEFRILERCARPLVDERETAWIAKLDATNKDKGYNICEIAGSFLGCKHTEETKARISEAKKGKPGTHCMPHTPEARAKISEAKKGRPNGRLGKKHTEETKRKISEIKKGVPLKEETKRRMSEVRTGKKMSPSHLNNCRANHWSKGPNRETIIAKRRKTLQEKKVKKRQEWLAHRRLEIESGEI